MTEPHSHESHSHEPDREVIVTDRSGGTGMIVGVIVAILALLLVLWLFFGLSDGDGGTADVIPDDVNVTVDVDSG